VPAGFFAEIVLASRLSETDSRWKSILPSTKLSADWAWTNRRRQNGSS